MLFFLLDLLAFVLCSACSVKTKNRTEITETDSYGFCFFVDNFGCEFLKTKIFIRRKDRTEETDQTECPGYPSPSPFPFFSPLFAFPLHRTTTPAATPHARIDTGDRPTASSPPPAVPRFVEQRTMEGSFQLNPDASPFIPLSLGSFADKTTEKQAGLHISSESSSKGDPSGGTFDPSQYEENDMDPLALAKLVFSMFPNVSTDFIDELLKANEFDMNLTIDMLHELNSQDMLHDDAELGLPTTPDVNDLHDALGLASGDNHHDEVSEICSNLNQALQNDKSATTSDVDSVLPKTNYPHDDLGLPDDDKSAGTSVAK